MDLLEKVDFDFGETQDNGYTETQNIDEPSVSCDESNLDPQSALRREEKKDSELKTPMSKRESQ